jgi:hypothetical protein
MCPVLWIPCNYFPVLVFARKDAGERAPAGAVLCDWHKTEFLQRSQRAFAKLCSGRPWPALITMHLSPWPPAYSCLHCYHPHLGSVLLFTETLQTLLASCSIQTPFGKHQPNCGSLLLLEGIHRNSKYFLFQPSIDSKALFTSSLL